MRALLRATKCGAVLAAFAVCVGGSEGSVIQVRECVVFKMHIGMVPCFTVPRVTAIKPNGVKGGTTVSLVGSGFTGVTKVMIGNGSAIPAVFAIRTDQKIALTVPKGVSDGQLQIRLFVPDGITISRVKLLKTG
jgi:hypothetical protein